MRWLFGGILELRGRGCRFCKFVVGLGLGFGD